jgi:hypothetical protein
VVSEEVGIRVGHLPLNMEAQAIHKTILISLLEELADQHQTIILQERKLG